VQEKTTLQATTSPTFGFECESLSEPGEKEHFDARLQRFQITENNRPIN